MRSRTNTTTIQVDDEVKSRMNTYKIVKSETYNDLILRFMDVIDGSVLPKEPKFLKDDNGHYLKKEQLPDDLSGVKEVDFKLIKIIEE